MAWLGVHTSFSVINISIARMVELSLNQSDHQESWYLLDMGGLHAIQCTGSKLHIVYRLTVCNTNGPQEEARKSIVSPLAPDAIYRGTSVLVNFYC